MNAEWEFRSEELFEYRDLAKFPNCLSNQDKDFFWVKITNQGVAYANNMLISIVLSITFSSGHKYLILIYLF